MGQSLCDRQHPAPRARRVACDITKMLLRHAITPGCNAQDSSLVNRCQRIAKWRLLGHDLESWSTSLADIAIRLRMGHPQPMPKAEALHAFLHPLDCVFYLSVDLGVLTGRPKRPLGHFGCTAHRCSQALLPRGSYRSRPKGPDLASADAACEQHQH